MSRDEPRAVEGPEGEEGVASAAVLRRIAAVAAVLALLAAAAFAMAGQGRRGLVLTLSAAVSIFALRSLEGVVRRLRPLENVAATGRAAPSGLAPTGLGWRYLLRILLLTALVFILTLWSRDGLALLIGLSAIPLAALVEAAIQLVRPAGDGGAEGGGEPRGES